MSISINLREWQKLSFATSEQLLGVTLPEDTLTQRIIQELSDSGRLGIIQHRRGLQLETSSYVGRITLGDVQITIRPKIDIAPLLRLLQYAYGLRRLNLFSTVTFDQEAFAFQDLLINQFLLEVTELLSRGLHRQYARQEEALISPRGHISFQKIANQGGIVQASLPCSHYLRQEDALINQVLLQGVQLGIQLANDEMLRMRLQHLEHFHFAGVSSIKLTWQVLHRVRQAINRLTTLYLPALTLIEIFYASTGISMDGDQQVLHLPGFLFDMNQFFQHLLSQVLSEHLPELRVEDQFELAAMMTYIDNPRKRQDPKPRPDYVIKRKEKIVAILDAKYRDLWEETLPASMLYQLIIYAIGQDACDSATILYPTTYPDARDARIAIRTPAHPRGQVSVIVRPVDLLQLDMLLLEAKERNNMHKRIKFAEQLIYEN